jgi:hypothetical protein
MNILIEVHCYNRRAITEIVLRQLYENRRGHDMLIVNDHSTEYDNQWLSQWATKTLSYPNKESINTLKHRAFKHFLDTDYTHLYMCDNDAFHTSDYIAQLDYLHRETHGLPVTLYRSSFIQEKYSHVSTVIEEHPDYEIRRGLCGGISVLLSRAHVERIVHRMSPREWNGDTKPAWDSLIWEYLETPYAVPHMSYVEHYGAHGVNHKTMDSDHALNPSSEILNSDSHIRSLIF